MKLVFLNYQDKITVPSNSIPESFLDINQPAWLKNITTNRDVVRIEDLRLFFDKANLDFETLQRLITNKDTHRDELALLITKIDIWNQIRDARPAFFAFYDEVQTEADHGDWQHQLRDRLGLGHYYPYPSEGNESIPVALMRYSLDDVVALGSQRNIPNAFALPTVLDGGMHEYFFPVPQFYPFGATVHLAHDQSDQLTAEALHYRIDYQPDHLIKIGWINRPHRVKNKSLRYARDLHLLALREEANRNDFGEMMENR